MGKHNRLVDKINQPLGILGQARRSRRMANKTPGNRSCRWV